MPAPRCLSPYNDFRDVLQADGRLDCGRAPPARYCGSRLNGAAHRLLPRTPSMRLDGKRALVTGAGRGIGLAAAAALAQAGAEVVLIARNVGDHGGRGEIRAEGGRADAIALDVTDLAAVRQIAETQAPFDVLVNNAGTNRPRPFLEVTEDDFDAIALLNQRAAFFVAQAVARRMVAAAGAAPSFTCRHRWVTSAARPDCVLHDQAWH